MKKNFTEIEIPFGAHDSELQEWEYTIPEGFSAEIKNGKVIVKKKESEDERIRKGLLRHFKNKTKPYWNEIAVKDIVTYLERQKEQKPAEWSEEDNRALNRAINICKNDFGEDSDTAIFLKSLPERFNFQPKQEWSEKDKERIQRIHDFIWKNRKGDIDTIYQIEKDADWLISLRPQPQRRDTYYDIIHDILAMLKDMDFTQITPEHRVSLLNDIRVKCKNADECAEILDEPHWKPSEEQMYALYDVLHPCDPVDKEKLESLYNDLKKLI